MYSNIEHGAFSSQDKALTVFSNRNHQESWFEKFSQINKKSAVKALAGLNYYRTEWTQTVELEPILDLSRSTIIEACNKLYELNLADREILPGTENKRRPTYIYRLNQNLPSQAILEFVHRKGLSNCLNLYDKDQTNGKEVIAVSSDDYSQAINNTSLTSTEVVEDPAFQDVDDYWEESPAEIYDDRVDEFNANELNQYPSVSCPENIESLTLSEVWSYVEEITQIFTEKLTEQENRIAQLEQELSLTRTKQYSKSPQERLHDVRSKLNIPSDKA
ncbi:MAG: hypothetical protein AB4372_03370 [Xenococcus sp. (in: cyanobacteria)]